MVVVVHSVEVHVGESFWLVRRVLILVGAYTGQWCLGAVQSGMPNYVGMRCTYHGSSGPIVVGPCLHWTSVTEC